MAFWNKLFKKNNSQSQYQYSPLQRAGTFNPVESGNVNCKRDIYSDFGYPDVVGFEECYKIYKRNGLAYAAIQKISKKTFEEYPSLQENGEAEQTAQEDLVKKHFDRIRFWQGVNEADRRGMVGGFGALILRLGDGKKFEEPVDPNFAKGKGGIEALVEVKPAWADQITVAEFYNDPSDPQYGEVKMYQFNENSGHNNTGKAQHRNTYLVHPDRIIVFSRDGTIYSESILRAGFNALLDIEKLVGAGAEGFWRNAKQSPYLVADKEISNERAMQDVGASNAEEFQTFLTRKMDGFSKGFDKYVFLKGIEPQFPDVRMTDPQWFYHNVVSTFAGSVDMPLKILIGTQSGERASGEDMKEWNLTNEARRSDIITPPINELIDRMQVWGMINNSDWHLHWLPLSNATEQEKIERAKNMSIVNFNQLQYSDDVAFLSDEIRDVLGYLPLKDAERSKVEIVRENRPSGTENKNDNVAK